MWTNGSTGYIFMSLAVLIVGWMSIFYIRMNIVKNDESADSSSQNSFVKNPIPENSNTGRSARKLDENAITQKRII